MGSKRPASAQVDGNSSLLLRPLTKEHYGLWECAANNAVARVSAATTVYVLGWCLITKHRQALGCRGT